MNFHALKSHRAASLKLLATLVVATSLTACLSEVKQLKRPKRQLTFDTSFRQVPPQPTYNRLRWVHPPETIPPRDIPEASSAPMLLPVIHFELQHTNLCEAVQVMATTAKYHTYCPASARSRYVSVNKLANINEIASDFSNQTGLRVEIQHDERRIVVGNNAAAQPEFMHE